MEWVGVAADEGRRFEAPFGAEQDRGMHLALAVIALSIVELISGQTLGVGARVPSSGDSLLNCPRNCPRTGKSRNCLCGHASNGRPIGTDAFVASL
jgi:hypothetical protein